MAWFVKGTEVLTSDGWKLVTSIGEKTSILVADPVTRKMKYDKCESGLYMDGSFRVSRMESSHMSLVMLDKSFLYTARRNDDGSMTPLTSESLWNVKKSHKLPLAGFKWEDYRYESPFVLPSVEQLEQYTRKPVTVPPRIIPIKKWLEFFGFWLADGCILEGFNTQGNRKYSVSVKQSEEREKKVVSLFKGIGFEPKKYDGSRPEHKNFNVYSKQLWTYLRQFGTSSERFIPREFMNLPKSMLLYLWRGYVFGNSSKSKNGQIQLSTVSHQLADDLQELILKIFGRVVQVRKQTKKYSYKEGTHTLYVINMTPDKGRDDYAGFNRSPVTFEEYNGRVYNIYVPDGGVILIRQNGKIMWVGGN